LVNACPDRHRFCCVFCPRKRFGLERIESDLLGVHWLEKLTGKLPNFGRQANLMDDQKYDDIATEYLHHALMNEAREYVVRGRSLGGSSDSEVQDIWVAAFRRWFDERTTANARNMDDAAAELRLRNIEPPYDRVKDKTDKIQAEIKRLSPDAPSEALGRSIDEFFEARKKPKN
jgi:hypothetical protein